jgi:hypothetical protein
MPCRLILSDILILIIFFDEHKLNIIFSILLLVLPLGSAVTQAVSCRLPTATTWVQSQFESCEIYGEQTGIGAGFLAVLRFPVPILIPPNAPPSSVIWGWYNRPISDRRTKWTESHPTP